MVCFNSQDNFSHTQEASEELRVYGVNIGRFPLGAVSSSYPECAKLGTYAELTFISLTYCPHKMQVQACFRS